MFGYVNVFKDELKVKEYAAYRSVYCGVCTACEKNLTKFSTLGLSYDAAFAALLLLSLTGEKVYKKSRRCIANPFKKRYYIASDSIDYAAFTWTLILYYNLLDDWHDNRSLHALFGMTLLNRAKNKAKREFPELSASIHKSIQKLSEIEKENCSNADIPALVSGELLSICLLPEYIGQNNIRPLMEMGKNLGIWIYMIDAVDDFENDKKNNNYNPLVLKYKDRDKAISGIEDSMTYTLSCVAASYELLDIKSNKAILDNIIYFGLAKKQHEIFAGKDKKDESL